MMSSSEGDKHCEEDSCLLQRLQGPEQTQYTHLCLMSVASLKNPECLNNQIFFAVKVKLLIEKSNISIFKTVCSFSKVLSAAEKNEKEK